MKETKGQKVNKLPIYEIVAISKGMISKTNVTDGKTSKFDNTKRDI